MTFTHSVTRSRLGWCVVWRSSEGVANPLEITACSLGVRVCGYSSILSTDDVGLIATVLGEATVIAELLTDEDTTKQLIELAIQTFEAENVQETASELPVRSRASDDRDRVP